MKKEVASALFVLTGFNVSHMEQLVNGYWGTTTEDFAKLSAENPWWLMFTEYGPIRIGPRKRVISIEWEQTKLRQRVSTDDSVTSDLTVIHAWTLAKCVEYLTDLRYNLKSLQEVAASSPNVIPVNVFSRILLQIDSPYHKESGHARYAYKLDGKMYVTNQHVNLAEVVIAGSNTHVVWFPRVADKAVSA